MRIDCFHRVRRRRQLVVRTSARTVRSACAPAACACRDAPRTLMHATRKSVDPIDWRPAGGFAVFPASHRRIGASHACEMRAIANRALKCGEVRHDRHFVLSIHCTSVVDLSPAFSKSKPLSSFVGIVALFAKLGSSRQLCLTTRLSIPSLSMRKNHEDCTKALHRRRFVILSSSFASPGQDPS